MELNKTYTISTTPDYTESFEEISNESTEFEEISVTQSSTNYPKTTSDSSFNFDKFDLQNALSTSSSEMTCNITFACNSNASATRIKGRTRHHILRKPSNENQDIAKKDKRQKITVKIKKLKRQEIHEEISTTSKLNNTSRTNKRVTSRRRAVKEKRKRSLDNDNSKSIYPFSESVSKYEEWETVESSDSTETIDEFSESLLDFKLEGFGSTIEHDIVATKYGLPYDIIICPCNASGITRFSLYKFVEIDNEKICTKSCYNFQERFGKINQKNLRKWGNCRRTEEFRKSSSIYDLFMKDEDPRIENILSKAYCGMKLFYPYCWIHFMKKYVMDLDEYDNYLETNSKKAVIASCRRVLREQEIFARHYRVRMIDFGRNIKFGKTTRDLDQNFEMACTFLKKEYPSLFNHLIKKYHFSTFVVKRMTIERNRLTLIKKWSSPKELNAKEDELRAVRQNHYL